MPETKGKRDRINRRRWPIGGGAMVIAAMFVGWALLISVFQYPFEPALTGSQRVAVSVAVLLFLIGILCLLLARRLRRRMAGGNVMAIAAAILFIALTGDGLAWLAAVVGLAASACMTAWGAVLARDLVAVDDGGESRR